MSSQGSTGGFSRFPGRMVSGVSVSPSCLSFSYVRGAAQGKATSQWPSSQRSPIPPSISLPPRWIHGQSSHALAPSTPLLLKMTLLDFSFKNPEFLRHPQKPQLARFSWEVSSCATKPEVANAAVSACGQHPPDNRQRSQPRTIRPSFFPASCQGSPPAT